MYGLHGKMKSQPGQRDALISLLLDASGGMDGNLLYVVSADPADPDGIWVYEVWLSQEYHRASLQLPSVQALIARARPLIAGMSDRVEFIPLGGNGLPPLHMRQVTLQSTITCPVCGHSNPETMPEDYCLIQYECPNCRHVLHPQAGDCCVFCSYGDVDCPSKQLEDR